MKAESRENRAFTIFARVLLAVFSVTSLYPFFWMVTSAFKDNKQIFLAPASLPSKIDLSVFPRAWQQAHLGTAFINSIIATVATVTVIIVTASLAAYALARMRFKGQKLILGVFVSGQIVSAQIVLVPLFTMFVKLQWLDSLFSLIAACTAFGIPLSVFLFWSFFSDIPREVEESTKIDGCPSLLF